MMMMTVAQPLRMILMMMSGDPGSLFETQKGPISPATTSRSTSHPPPGDIAINDICNFITILRGVIR